MGGKLNPLRAPSLIPKGSATWPCLTVGTQHHKPIKKSLFFLFFPSNARLFPGRGAAPGEVRKLLPAFPASPPIPWQHLDTQRMFVLFHREHSCPAPPSPAFLLVLQVFPSWERDKDSLGTGSLSFLTQIPVM